MCAQKPGDPRKTKRVADYVVVANYRVVSIGEDRSRSAQCNEIDFREEEGAKLCNQQRATEGLKGRRRRVVFVLLDDAAAAMKGLGLARSGRKGSRRQERQRPRKVDGLNAKKRRKLNLNLSPNTLLSDYHSRERGWRRHDNERKREGRCGEGWGERER
ncbi:hypothetical protein N431DRAFT_199154 [Stipitochalara longipes BDJ]|nr:hypothetical protein N431DRAFT_199154 [Stipitochalara longipes BDJ]